MAKFKRKSFADKKKEIDKLAADRNEQVQNYFKSPEDMKEYLSFMSKFYNYSVRNSTLIQKQFRGAEAVGSFNFWKSEGFQVQKGEKGISILVPAPFKTFDRKKGETTERVNLKDATPAEKAAIDRGEIKTKEWMAYAKGNVFDVSQTNATADDLPKVFPNKWLDGKVENYEEMFQSMKKLGEDMGVETMPRPMEELGVAKGAYVEFTKQNEEGEMVKGRGIELNPRNSELQNVKTMIHELAHADLHSSDSKGHDRTHPEKEFQAEMTAYTVASHFNLDTSDYSLQYLKAYTEKDTDIQDKFILLEEVKETSFKFINHLENDLEPVRQTIAEKQAAEDLKESFSDFQVASRMNGIVKVEDMTMEQFESAFQTEDGRNILSDKVFQEGTPLERVQAFNNLEKNWNGDRENVKFVDESKDESQFFVLDSNKELKHNVMSGREMDRYLALEHMDSFQSLEAEHFLTHVVAIEPKGDDDNRKYEVLDIVPFALGDPSYSSLESHMSFHNDALAEPLEVPKGLPPEGDEKHIEDITSHEFYTKNYETMYAENLYLHAASVKDENSIEISDKSLSNYEKFLLGNTGHDYETMAYVRQDVKEEVTNHKAQMDTLNVTTTLKGDFETIQQKKEDEKTGGVTEEKLEQRMEVENRYMGRKYAALEHGLIDKDKLQHMEASVLENFKEGRGKEPAAKEKDTSAIQTSGKDSPYSSETSKQKNAGMSM